MVTYEQYFELLNESITGNDIVVIDSGLTLKAAYSMLRLRDGARFIHPGSQGTMGACIPICIGVAEAYPHKSVIGVTGDGSLMMQLPYLHNLTQPNVRITVLCNGGYGSIRLSQDRWCQSRRIGTSPPLAYPEHKNIRYMIVDGNSPIRRPILDRQVQGS